MGKLKAGMYSFSAKGKIGVGRKALVGAVPAVVIEHGTIDKVIIASPDDGWSRVGSFDNAGAALYAGCRSANDSYRTFLRFPGITIPLASPIITCYLELFGAGHDGTPLTTFYMENTPDPAAPTSEAEMDTAVAVRTAAGVNLDTVIPIAWTQSPELKTVLQEIVTSREGLSDEAIQFLWLERNADRSLCDGLNRQILTSYDWTDHSRAPKLHIEY